MPKVLKIKSWHIFAITPGKHGGDEVDCLPAEKHESFLQEDSITFGGHCQACSKYPKQQVFNIFAISQRKREG